jgi:hypothetical protein
MMSNGIYQAMAAAMGEIEPIAKGRRNKEQNFDYRGVDDIMNSLAPILVKNKIFIYPEVTNVQRQERATKSGGCLLYSVLTVKYHFAHEDGSEICCTVVGEGMDSGDKASNKAMAVAYKYACLQAFCIPTADVKDPDGDTPPDSTPTEKTTQKPNGSNRGGGNPPGDEQKIKIGEEIRGIVEAKDPGGLPYFKEMEIEQERKNFMSGDLQAAEKQRERLKKYLVARKAGRKPGPPVGEPPNFEDDIPF